jgi:hypothetical protein
MVRLPISDLEVTLREPDGADELLLREMSGSPTTVALALLPRLAGSGEWEALTVTDFEILLLGLRSQLFGDFLALGLICPTCGARIEIGFRVAAYLQGIEPRRPAGVTPHPDRPSWFRFGEASFCLPTAGDQVAVVGQPRAAHLLAQRCIDPPELGRRQLNAVERVMAAMAPEVSRPVKGNCPECSATVEAPLHITRLVISELYRVAAAVYDEVDLIAQSYHWPEPTILALPRRRRKAYAERGRRARQRTA